MQQMWVFPCIYPGASPGEHSSAAHWPDCGPFRYRIDDGTDKRHTNFILIPRPHQGLRNSRRTNRRVLSAASGPSVGTS